MTNIFKKTGLATLLTALAITSAAPLAAQGRLNQIGDVGAPDGLLLDVQAVRLADGFYRRQSDPTVYRITSTGSCQVANTQQMWAFGGFSLVSVLPDQTPFPFASAPVCAHP